jgi:hypothetical protein
MAQRVTLRKRQPYNTTSNRRRVVKTPGGKLVVHHLKKKAVSIYLSNGLVLAWMDYGYGLNYVGALDEDRRYGMGASAWALEEIDWIEGMDEGVMEVMDVLEDCSMIWIGDTGIEPEPDRMRSMQRRN